MKNLMLTALSLLLFVATAMTQNVPAYVPTNGLVGWWPFNGNANDESGNGNNGTVNGATLTTDRFGNVNKAYSFDGSTSYIIVGNNINFNDESFSISSWVKPTSPPSDLLSGIVSTLAYNPSAPFKGVEMNFWAALKLTCQIGNNSNWSGIDGSVSSQLQAFQLNQWYYCVITFDNTTLKMYLDNILIGSVNITSFLSNLNSPILFGARGQYPNPQIGSYLNGQLDDIGIWNRALTQQEISNLYNGNATNLEPITDKNQFYIHPNPARDHITINYGNFSLMSGYQLRITNSLGQQMFQTTINQQSDYLDLSSWTGNGIYFVNIIDPSGNTVDIKKIVLQ